MTRQAFIRVMLSLLLLISQQMASSHVMSHLAGSLDRIAAHAHQPLSDDMSSAFAQDQSCSQCLAFAQLAGPLISTPPDFILPQQPRFAIDAPDVPVAGARIILAFQSRGPPVLS
ncbi:MAG: hypothetical protein V4484_13370 [Pseudomonadota bacterium]